MVEMLSGWAGLILGFSGLIFIHELGHFALAKWNGVRVYVFSLGMGPYLISFTYKGTIYALSLIPMGGYVKMMGQDDLNPSEDANPDPHDYRNKRAGQKAAILAAGAGFNILLTISIFTFCYWHGIDLEAPTIGAISPDSRLAAAVIKGPGGEDQPAKLAEGERILAVNGVPVKSFFEAMLQVSGAPKDSEIILQVDRQPPEDLVYVKVRYDKGLGATSIGLSPFAEREKYFLGFTTKDTITVMKVLPGSAAADAGLKEHDQILRINGKPLDRIDTFINEIRSYDGTKKLELYVSSGGAEHTVPLAPRLDEKSGNYQIGVGPGLLRQVNRIDQESQAYKLGMRTGDYFVAFQPDDEHWEGDKRLYSSGTIMWEKDAFEEKGKADTGKLTGLASSGSEYFVIQEHADIYHYRAEGGFFDALSMAWTDTEHFGFSVFTVLRGFFTGDVGGKAISGPLGIGKLMYKVGSSKSLISFIWFLGFISLNLGTLQFLPIPLLDGWHLLMVLVEKIKGSPVAPKVLEISQVVGIVIVGSLLLFATYNDFLR